MWANWHTAFFVLVRASSLIKGDAGPQTLQQVGGRRPAHPEILAGSTPKFGSAPRLLRGGAGLLVGVEPGSTPEEPGSPPAEPGSPPAEPGSPPAEPGSPLLFLFLFLRSPAPHLGSPAPGVGSRAPPRGAGLLSAEPRSPTRGRVGATSSRIHVTAARGRAVGRPRGAGHRQWSRAPRRARRALHADRQP